MKKRFVIEFTVETEDYSDESIKNQALQELTCMVPFPEDIDFHRKDNPWHTGEPTEEGWYLIQTEDGDFMAVEKNEHGLWFVDSFGCSKVNLESIVAWQKIEPYKED